MASSVAPTRIANRARVATQSDLLENKLADDWREPTVKRAPWHLPGVVPNEHIAVRRVREYLHAHYALPVRLDTLATVAGLSAYHLSRVFRSATGLPPHSYLVQLRVARAKELLLAGQPVSRVAFATGFSDQSHLTRFFKRIVGVPPGQYQQSVLRRALVSRVLP